MRAIAPTPPRTSTAGQAVALRARHSLAKAARGAAHSSQQERCCWWEASNPILWRASTRTTSSVAVRVESCGSVDRLRPSTFAAQQVEDEQKEIYDVQIQSDRHHQVVVRLPLCATHTTSPKPRPRIHTQCSLTSLEHPNLHVQRCLCARAASRKGGTFFSSTSVS